MQEIKDKALAFLEANPEVEVIYVTTDGFLFYKEYDAQNHALFLDKENPKVEVFKSETEKEEKVEKPKKK